MGEPLWHRALCTVRWFLHHFEAVLKCYSFQLISKPGGFIFTFFFSLSLLCPLLLLLPFLLSPTPSHSASVKYIKEMSAFFKSSGSPGAGLPWDSPPSTPQRGTELTPAEVKEPRSIPLKMCQVSRKQCPPDTENRYYMLKLQRFM